MGNDLERCLGPEEVFSGWELAENPLDRETT